ncbi:hypothetical protein [Sulfurimonas sp.]|uniref:hypothetical protein n=1 Tax=Sulfurimonas sp. TaxID=2022749 RepID=UPI003562FA79
MKIQGRIIFYNPQTGKGKIILHTKEKMNFSIEEWDEFELAPEVNLLVDCEMDKDILIGITVSSENQTVSRPAYERDLSTDEEYIDDETEVEASTYTVDEALKIHFSPIEQAIGKPPSVINTKEQLDYFLAKRFLFTAYNNLRSLDPKIYEHGEMKEKINTIDTLHKAYNSLSEQVDIPQYAFEMIFLRIQPEYIKNQEQREKYVSAIPSLTELINSLEADLKSGEENLKTTTNKKIRLSIGAKLKKIRGVYVDAIHERACIKEELEDMVNIKQIYTKKYFREFDKKLSILQVKYKDMIERILNYKAYDFDSYMWKNAVKSKSIKEYFKTSGIKGTYSTETFLRYYLKTLDQDKLKYEQEELFRLLNYFESKNS